MNNSLHMLIVVLSAYLSTFVKNPAAVAKEEGILTNLRDLLNEILAVIQASKPQPKP